MDFFDIVDDYYGVEEEGLEPEVDEEEGVEIQLNSVNSRFMNYKQQWILLQTLKSMELLRIQTLYIFLTLCNHALLLTPHHL